MPVIALFALQILFDENNSMCLTAAFYKHAFLEKLWCSVTCHVPCYSNRETITGDGTKGGCRQPGKYIKDFHDAIGFYFI